MRKITLKSKSESEDSFIKASDRGGIDQIQKKFENIEANEKELEKRKKEFLAL